MRIGDLYNFINNRIRVMMFGEKEVFYQTVNNDDSFVYEKNRTLSYYRTSKEYFKRNATFIKQLALTEREIEIHRPDLPLRLNCFSGLFWTNENFESEIEFCDFLKSKGIKKEQLVGLESSKIVIIPNSQLQSNKKPVVLESRNISFSGVELLNESFKIQSEYVIPDKPYFSRLKKDTRGLSGIGMYRLGIKGNIPSYYLGGEISMGEWFLVENK